MVLRIRLGILRHNLGRKERMEASLFKTFRQPTSTSE